MAFPATVFKTVAESPSHTVAEDPVLVTRAALLLQEVPPYPPPAMVSVDPPVEATFPEGACTTMNGALKLNLNGVQYLIFAMSVEVELK